PGVYKAEKRIEQIEKAEDRLEAKKADVVEEDPTKVIEVKHFNQQLLDFQNERNELTGYVVASSPGSGFFTKLIWWLFNVDITGFAVLEEEKPLENSTSVIIDNIVNAVEVEYYTEAPVAEEENLSSGKRIVISSDIHYEDILAYTELANEVPGANIELFWLANDSKLKVPFDAFDTNGNGLTDYIEWIVPSLSNQTYELVIEISNAYHLDSSRAVISDIYDYVKARDGNFSFIPSGDYARVTFNQPLDSARDITVYARSNVSSAIEIYVKDSDEKITEITGITQDNKYRVLLTGLNGSYDEFDLKMMGDIEIDYIVDPTVSACGTLSSAGAYTLTQNISGTGTCITIGAANVGLDCAGYTITFNTDGGIAKYGIRDSGSYDNVSITNCNIVAGSASGLSGYGIYFSSATGSRIANNTITTDGTSSNYGIYIESSSSNTLSNNTINSRGTSNYNYGISLYSSSSNNISYNTITTNGTDTNYGIVLTDSGTNTFLSNTLSTTGSTNSHGIYLSYLFITGATAGNNFTSNTLNSIAGNDLNIANAGINNTWLIDQPIRNYTFTGAGSKINIKNSTHGLIEFFNPVTGSGTNLFGNATSSIKISNNSIFVNATNLNASANITLYNMNEWSFVTPAIMKDNTVCDSTTTPVCFNFSGLTAATVIFNVSSWSNYSIVETADVTPPTSSANSDNSSSTTPVNGTVVQLNITIKDVSNISFFRLTVNDTVSKAWANGSLQSASGNASFVFNYTISNFSIAGGTLGWKLWANDTLGYAGESSAYTLTIKSQCGILGAAGTYTLTSSVTSNGTCFLIGAANVALDCAGYTITYKTGGANNGYGINNSGGYDNVNITNCNIVAANNSGTNGYGVYFNSVTGSRIVSNNLSTNGTSANYGIYLDTFSNNNNLTSNTITTNGTDTNYGIRLSSADSNTLFSNSLNTRGTSNSNIGIRLNSADNNNLTSNTITTNGVGIETGTSTNNTLFSNTINSGGTSDSNYGIHLDSSSNNNNLTSNTITTNGTYSNYGIYLSSSSTNNITSNTITTGGTQTNNYGIYLSSSSNTNIISSNTITTNGTSSNYGIGLISSSNSNTFTSNTLSTSGSTDSHGIYITTATTANNNFTNNTLNSISGSDLSIATAGINGTWLIDQPIRNYSFTGSGGTLKVKNSTHGIIEFFNSVNGSGKNLFGNSTSDIRIGNNTLRVNATNLNASANLTLYNMDVWGFSSPSILKDGVACSQTSAPPCFNFTTLTASTVTFNVTSWSNYSVGETPDVIPPNYTSFVNNGSDSTFISGIINWSVYFADGSGISGYKFAHNQTGTLANGSFILGNYDFINNTLSITAAHAFICGQYWFNDTANNINQTNLSCFTVANSVPLTPTIKSPANNELNITRKIDFNTTDADSDAITFRISINGSLNISTAANISVWNGSDGTYSLKVSAWDGLNSSSNTSAITFTLDTTAPTVSISYPTNNRNISSASIALNGTSTDNIAS
ncbi:right-handed parallel beta-helix repeat-containing protein, partial [Candidatus Woesearchaeota archaeon]|nr:right-handed parallel beta-helix repeat-containing protein [Candidatus Woesearchaeota archaeon]